MGRIPESFSLIQANRCASLSLHTRRYYRKKHCIIRNIFQRCIFFIGTICRCFRLCWFRFLRNFILLSRVAIRVIVRFLCIFVLTAIVLSVSGCFRLFVVYCNIPNNLISHVWIPERNHLIDCLIFAGDFCIECFQFLIYGFFEWNFHFIIIVSNFSKIRSRIEISTII